MPRKVIAAIVDVVFTRPFFIDAVEQSDFVLRGHKEFKKKRFFVYNPKHVTPKDNRHERTQQIR